MNSKSKLSAICSNDSYDWLQRWIISRTPNFPYPMKPEKYFYSNTNHREYLSKFIESVMVLVLRSIGADPVKAPDKGKRIDNIEIHKDVLGHQRVNVRSTYVKDKTVREGRADVTCFFKGSLGLGMYNFEIKVGRDAQSEAQKKEQERCEKNGEFYIIIKNIDDFISYL